MLSKIERCVDDKVGLSVISNFFLIMYLPGDGTGTSAVKGLENAGAVDDSRSAVSSFSSSGVSGSVLPRPTCENHWFCISHSHFFSFKSLSK